MAVFCTGTLSWHIEHSITTVEMNPDKRIVTESHAERLTNCREELSLETAELLDVNDLCGDDSDDTW